MTDVDFGDVIDYLAADPATRSILLYIESIRDARKFLSAARAAARNKTVLAIKSGRAPEGARAAASHTGALAGSDDVYDAAIRRAGVLRVFAIDELFSAVETLGTGAAGARGHPDDPHERRGSGGARRRLARPARREARRARRRFDPPSSTRVLPVDVVGREPHRHHRRRRAGALPRRRWTPSSRTARRARCWSCTCRRRSARAPRPPPRSRRRPRPRSGSCRPAGSEERRSPKRGPSSPRAGVPTYDTPEDAVTAFLQLVDYRHNQEMLMEIPALHPRGTGRRRASPRDRARRARRGPGAPDGGRGEASARGLRDPHRRDADGRGPGRRRPRSPRRSAFRWR